MARKTHPISHRLGVTLWWPSRTPEAIKGKNRYAYLLRIIRGVLLKFGYKSALPNIASTLNNEGKISVVVSKTESRPIQHKKPTLLPTTSAVPIYIMSYLSALISEYENINYKLDMREIQNEIRQGTASILAQSIITNEKDMIGAMIDLQRRMKSTKKITFKTKRPFQPKRGGRLAPGGDA